jgi:two-component system, sensor histidine kinase and response regulator
MHVGPTRILLIDDDAVDRQMVRRALKASTLQHTLVEAPDGASGLAAAQRETFDCVLLDYRLRGCWAFSFLLRVAISRW